MSAMMRKPSSLSDHVYLYDEQCRTKLHEMVPMLDYSRIVNNLRLIFPTKFTGLRNIHNYVKPNLDFCHGWESLPTAVLIVPDRPEREAILHSLVATLGPEFPGCYRTLSGT